MLSTIKIPLRSLIPAIILTLFLAVFTLLMYRSYPLIGQDFLLFYPRLLAGHWHFEGAGLLPFRYIPHLCGGLPLYGNPQDIYYSLLQFLSFFGDLWMVTLLTLGGMLLIGYIGWYRFARDIIKMESAFAHLLALIIVANGYYIMHMTAGHMTFHTTPLIGWLLWFLLQEKKESRRIQMCKSAAFGLLAGMILHAGGYFVLMQTAIAWALILPFDLLLRHQPMLRVKQLFLNAFFYGAAALLVCASKLTAIIAMMRFFPRFLPFTRLETEQSMLTFFSKIFWRIPQSALAFDGEKFPLGLHEYSMFLSPLAIIGLPVAIFFVLRKQSWHKRALLILWTIFVVFLFSQLTRGYGWLADAIHEIPIFSSWRISVRFVYILAVFLSIAGTYGIAELVKVRWQKQTTILSAVFSLLTILSFYGAYKTILSPEFLDLTVHYPVVQEAIRESGEYWKRPVTLVEDYGGQNVSDLQYIVSGTTGKTCYEILLTGVTFLPELQNGPVDVVTDNRYNINNPACMQYPEVNGCEPGDRIAVEDGENAEWFITGEQPGWRVPWWQRGADGISLISFCSFLVLSLYCLVSAVWRRFHREA